MLALLALLFTLTVYPRVSQAPSELIVVARFEPRENARWLVLELDGEGNYQTQSITQLEGLNEPITHRHVWRDVTSGHYTVEAFLLDQASKVIATATPVAIQIESRF